MSRALGRRRNHRLSRRRAHRPAADTFHITVKGRQTHGARPWAGVDPIVIASQIVLGLQTIQSRQVDVTSDPSVLTVGIFKAGNRTNIIPDKAELEGTLRTYNLEMRDFIKRRVKETAEAIAISGGGEAVVVWNDDYVIPLINNVRIDEAHAADAAARCRRRQGFRNAARRDL